HPYWSPACNAIHFLAFSRIPLFCDGDVSPIFSPYLVLWPHWSYADSQRYSAFLSTHILFLPTFTLLSFTDPSLQVDPLILPQFLCFRGGHKEDRATLILFPWVSLTTNILLGYTVSAMILTNTLHIRLSIAISTLNHDNRSFHLMSPRFLYCDSMNLPLVILSRLCMNY
uniref:Uncharacterized protein n=1 Tax=Anser cygnoides TaxID=8845 RepID=A0A8B9DML0_ANSCY